jgi:hypothetical protein
MIKVVQDCPTRLESAAVAMSVVADSGEIARFQAQMDRFDRNCQWYQAHGREIFAQHRGKFICVAGQELFVGDSACAALALAQAAHPEDDGRFLHRVRKDGSPLIYAH